MQKAHVNYVKMIDHYIKRLRILRHSSLQKNERIQLHRKLGSIENYLSKILKQRRNVSSPFIHTVVSGRNVLLHPSVLVNRRTTKVKISRVSYSPNKIDQAIHQLVLFRNNFEFYWELMNHNQKAAMLRFMSRYARKPVFKKIGKGNQKIRKTQLQQKTIMQDRTNKQTSPNNLAKYNGKEKELIKKNSSMTEELKRRKRLNKAPRGKKLQENYSPYPQEDFDIYIDSILEDEQLDQILDLDNMQDSYQ